MNRAVFGAFPYDDPPAPEEPPQNHTPLSPPRSHKIFNPRPATSSGICTVDSRSSTPGQLPPSRPQTPKMRTRSADETQRCTKSNSFTARCPVTKDKTGLMAASNALPSVDKRPSTTIHALLPNGIPATFTPAGADLKPHVRPAQNEPQSAPGPLACGAQGKRALPKRSAPSLKTSTMHSRESSSRIPGHPYSSAKAADSAETYFVMRRDSIDTDGRSLISSFLDAYCRSEAGDAESESLWPDDTDANIILSDDTFSLEYASDFARRRSRDRPDSESTIVVLEETPKRSKPASLAVALPPDWKEASTALDLPPEPQTAPVGRNARPLPPLPPVQSVQRQVRPLPRPPMPPPYTSPVEPLPALTPSSQSSASSSATSSPASGSNSFASVSSSSSASSDSSIEQLANQPNISKRPLLAPLLTISASSSVGYSSPITPDIPFPPSPATAKRQQLSKLSKMLGEDITPDLLCGHQSTSSRPLPPKTAPPTGSVLQRVPRRVDSRPNIRSAPAPAPTFRDAEILNTRLRSARAERPRAIYLHDDTCEESHQYGDSAVDEGSMSELTHSTRSSVPVKVAIGEDQEDRVSLSSAGGLTISSEGTSPAGDSILEELDDFEEGRIGWALQNFIKYQTPSRVKRTSKTWILERNGQRWEEQNYTNVLKALRQL